MIEDTYQLVNELRCDELCFLKYRHSGKTKDKIEDKCYC